ncbi:hypothetical protein [Amycolatopsis sp. NPDC051716]|jgi:hypothetical protein|uniref:hypothetical protein n=1 Tax=Amycolatopsis sp. NPDC051716 TaxID=3155804 RepID=UPI00341770FB
MRFSKLRAGGRDHILVNTIDSADDDWKRLAALICAESSGVSGDGFGVLSHRGRANFDLRCFDPDGTPAESDATWAAVAATSIRRRYGYRNILLHADGRACRTQITGDTVSVQPWPAGNSALTRVDVTYLLEGELIG